jgi:hypothetical protein
MKILFTVLLSILFIYGCGKTENTKQSISETRQKSVSGEQISAKENANILFNFENYETDKIPAGWMQSFTGKGKGTDWKIVDDNGNKVLAQLSSDNPNYHFNLIVFDSLDAGNLTMEVDLKGVRGNMDQGGGFVWRFIDADNYYVVRANPLEDNVVLYKVVKGVRTDLPLLNKGRTYGVDVEKLGNGWNKLKLVVVNDLFMVYLNGKELFQVRDTIFANSGKAGLWTKADAVTYFDNFTIDIDE